LILFRQARNGSLRRRAVLSGARDQDGGHACCPRGGRLGTRRRVRRARGTFLSPEIVDEVEAFVETLGAEDEPESVLATILFTDLVGSTAKAAELGDRRRRELLGEHHARTRRELLRHRGIELDTAGDGFFARFDGPARAIRCACAIRDSVAELGLELRAGLHTGECEVIDDKVTGIAVSIGARVAAQAGGGEVLVSQTVKDLVAGSGLSFVDHGTTELKGVPGQWRLYAVLDA
jgi:class 3 adenylate cyclase